MTYYGKKNKRQNIIRIVRKKVTILSDSSSFKLNRYNVSFFELTTSYAITELKTSCAIF